MRNAGVLRIMAALICMMGERATLAEESALPLSLVRSTGTASTFLAIPAESNIDNSLRQRFAKGDALIFRGGDREAAAVLGIAPKDRTDGRPPEFFAVQQLPNGVIRRGYFFLQTPTLEKFTVTSGSRTLTPIERRRSVRLDEATRQKALESLLLSVQEWAAQTPRSGAAGRARRSEAAGPGRLERHRNDPVDL